MDSEARTLRNVSIVLVTLWIYVGCAALACWLTGARFPGMMRLHQIVDLPPLTLTVSLVIFLIIMGSIVWLWFVLSPRTDSKGGEHDL